MTNKIVLSSLYILYGAYSGFRLIFRFDEVANANRSFFADSAWASYADLLSWVSIASPFLCFAVAASIYLKPKWYLLAPPALLVAVFLFPLGAILGIGTVVWYVSTSEADAV